MHGSITGGTIKMRSDKLAIGDVGEMWSGAGDSEISAGSADSGGARGKFDPSVVIRPGRFEHFGTAEYTRDGFCIIDCARCKDGYVEIFNDVSRRPHNL